MLVVGPGFGLLPLKKKQSHTHAHTHMLKDNQSSVTFFKQSVAAECGLWPEGHQSDIPLQLGKYGWLK